MNKDSFVDFETAKRLKPLGYKEECLSFYEADGTWKWNNGTQNFDSNWLSINKDNIDYYSAPSWQDVKKWLWENYRLYYVLDSDRHLKMVTVVRDLNKNGAIIIPEKLESVNDFDRFESPIDSERDAIKQTIKHLSYIIN